MHPEKAPVPRLAYCAGSAGTGGTSGAETGPLLGVPKLQLRSSTAAAREASSACASGLSAEEGVRRSALWRWKDPNPVDDAGVHWE